jgi:predicted metal-binding protein
LVGFCVVVRRPILSCHCMLSCDRQCSVAGHFPR